MLTLRLSRIGKKGQPMYRIVVSEKGRDPWGDNLEIVGSYNPRSKELQAKADRINHWISKGAQASVTVTNLLIDKGVIKGEKTKFAKTATKKKEAKK